MLELKSKELEIKFNDKIEKIKYPTVMHMKALNEKLKAGQEEIETLVKLLVALGMNQETANNLEVEHINAIVKELTQVKK